jgi:serine protease Do
MIRKLSIILTIATVCAIAYGQQPTTSTEATPEKQSGIGGIIPGLLGGQTSNGTSYLEQLELMHQENLRSMPDGYLGVETSEINKQNMSKYGLSAVRGVAVGKVSENSPAQQAGIQVGDVIVAINGDEVTSVRKLMRLIGEISVDHQAKITILRNGVQLEVVTTITKRPMPKFGGEAFRMGVPMQLGEGNIMQSLGRKGTFFSKLGSILSGKQEKQIGANVYTLTKQLAAHFGITEGKGLLITEVAENSPAANAGLKAGDVITEVDGKQISSQTELIQIIASKKEGEILLTIVRDRNRQTINVTPTVAVQIPNSEN